MWGNLGRVDVSREPRGASAPDVARNLHDVCELALDLLYRHARNPVWHARETALRRKTKPVAARRTPAKIAKRMTAQLDAAIPAEPRRSFPVLLEQAWAALTSERLQPFMRYGSSWRQLRPAVFSRTAMLPAKFWAGSLPGQRIAWSPKARASRLFWGRCSWHLSKACIFSRRSAEATSRTQRALSLLRLALSTADGMFGQTLACSDYVKGSSCPRSYVKCSL